MTLLEFIADPDRKAALAAACKTNEAWLWQIATGWTPAGGKPKRASTKLAQRIERESERLGCRVSKASLRPDVWSDNDPVSDS